MILSGSHATEGESENVDGLIAIEKGKISIHADLPLSIIAGRLKYSDLIRILKFSISKYNETYDFRSALTKFLLVNRNKQAEVYKKQMQASQDRITEFQTALSKTISDYVNAQNQLEVFAKMSDHDRIFENLNKVKDADFCKDLYFERENLIAILPDIRVNFQGIEYHFGDFKVHLNISNGTVQAYRIDGTFKHDRGQKERTRGFFHPHVTDSGQCCLGNYQKLISEFIFNGDFASAVSLMLEFLVNYNEANPYRKIEMWKSDEQLKAPATPVTAQAVMATAS